jgi:hypothetical protein
MKKLDYFHVALAYWIGYLVFMFFYFYFSKVDVYDNSVKVKAEIVDQIWGVSRSKSGNFSGYYPQFEFRYKDSLYTSADRRSWFRNKKPGQEVTVVFPDGMPDQAEIYAIVPYWFSFPTMAVSCIVAAFFFAIPLIGRQYSLYKKE